MKLFKGLRQIKESVKNAKDPRSRVSVAVYFTIRGLIILCLIRQLLLRNYYDVFLCILSLVLIFIPVFINTKTKIKLPSGLEIAVCFFVYAAEILGEINSYYIHIRIWDTILHTVNGFLAAAIGFGIIDLINKHAKRTHMSPVFVVLVSFCFSMTIGVLWEFFEYNADIVMKTDMQKDTVISSINTTMLDETRSNKVIPIKNIDHTVIYTGDGGETVIEGGYLDVGLNDTMKDLFVNMIGAVVFSVYGYLYLHRQDKYKFIERFIITSKE